MQDISQGGIFFSSPQQKLSIVCQISMVRQPVRISLPMFWTRASSKNFYKIIKSPNCSLETDQHSNHYLPRRYVANGEDITRNSHCKRHINFSVAILGFVINRKKSVLHHVKQMEVLGLVIDTEKMTFTLSEKKLKHMSQQCQEIFKQP